MAPSATKSQQRRNAGGGLQTSLGRGPSPIRDRYATVKSSLGLDRRRGVAERQRMGAVCPHRLLPFALMIPELAVVAIFFLWPSAQAIAESLRQSNAFGLGARFAGLANFRAALSSGYLQALEVTALFTVVTTVASMALSLVLAVQVEQTGRLRGVHRTLFIWSYAVPGAVAGAVWLSLFEPHVGPAARFLGAIGVS